MLVGIDMKLFELINKNCANAIFDRLMPLVTRLGSGEFLSVVAIVLILVARPRKKMVGILLLAGLAGSYYVTDVLKNIFARPRPFTLVPYSHILVSKVEGYSLPSGHAAMAFMAALILSRFFKRPALFFTLAALVAFSRVYIGVHFVTDVLAGAIIGILIGYILLRIAKITER